MIFQGFPICSLNLFTGVQSLSNVQLLSMHNNNNFSFSFLSKLPLTLYFHLAIIKVEL